jgi:hypothetical protein
MTLTREDRVDTLRLAAQRKSEQKTIQAERAIRSLRSRGVQITFRAVSQEARVSHTFLYHHPTLRRKIEGLKASRAEPNPASGPGSESNIVQNLTEHIRHLKSEHQAELSQLKRQHQLVAEQQRQRLEAAHGQIVELRRELRRHKGDVE